MDPTLILERLKAATRNLSRAQLASLVGAFAAVVVLVAGSAYWLNGVTYRLLFSDLDPESAATVVARLKTLKVPYKLDDGGRAVRVPEQRVDELRLEFASQGMPTTGRIGFEIFDRTAFGATEFLEHVNYRRALEGEIARTIGTISEVASARVHIAMAKESLFATQEEPAKASVVLKLKNNRPLSPATARAIQGLVASGVEGLRTDHVTIIDSFGRSLVRPADDGDESGDGVQAERQQRYEKDLATRIIALLEPVVGPDHVRANVAVRLNSRTQEETEERFDPAGAVVRSRQMTSDATAGPGGTGGVAGAKGNLPPAAPAPANTPAPVAAAPVTGSGRSAETTNYEISKVVRHTLTPRGDIARLSVAVMVDDDEVVTQGKDGKVTRTRKPRDAESLRKLQGLVAAAVGFDAERGDQLTVEAIPFDEPAEIEAPTPGLWQRFGPEVTEVGRIGVVLLIGLLAFFMVVRPITRRVLAPIPEAPPMLPKALPKTVDEVQGELESQLEAQLEATEAKSAQGKRATVLAKRVSTMTQKEPDHVARLLRAWLAEGER